jgi:hypothetical protein
MKCDSWASLLARTFASLCFGRKPKAKVATTWLKKSKKGRQEWNKACVETNICPKKLNILMKTK